MKQARGLRNNNPGNIDWNKNNDWKGQTGIETGVPNPRFATFIAPIWGIRAIAKILMTYHRKGFNTVFKMINRYAPDLENDTNAYVRSVCAKIGVSANKPIEKLTVDSLIELVKSIIKHENGLNPYSDDLIREAINEAFK